MVEAAKESLFFTGVGELSFGFEHQVGGTFAKTLIGNQADRVFDLLAFKKLIDSRYGKTGIGNRLGEDATAAAKIDDPAFASAPPCIGATRR